MITDSTISPLLSEAFGEAIRDAGGHVDVVNLEGYPLMEDPLELVDIQNTKRWYPDWIWEGAKQADVLLCLAFLSSRTALCMPAENRRIFRCSRSERLFLGGAGLPWG